MELESLRIKAIRYKYVAIILVICIYVPLAYTISQRFNIPTRVMRYAALPIFYLGYMGYVNRKRQYIQGFNETITKTLIKEVKPNWSHDAEVGLPPEDIFRTKLVVKKPYAYSSNLITGDMDGVAFNFCHLETSKKNILSARLPQLVFKGYYFEFDFHKYTKEEIHVHPPMMKEFGEVLGLPKKVETDSDEFDKTFKTFCNDPVAARYVLTLGLMSRMLDLQKILPGSVSFLFSKGKVFIALKIKGSTIEPKLKLGRGTSMEEITKVHDQLFELVELFVKEMKLQLELWNKEVSA